MALLQKAYLGAVPLFAEKPWFYGNQPKLVDSAIVTAANVTASSTIHTKGAWSELIASTSANASLIVVTVGGINANTFNTATLLDIGNGAAGSETAIASDIAVGGAFSTANNLDYAMINGAAIFLPVNTPSGTRIAARVQALNASDTAVVNIYVYDLGDGALLPSTVDVLGSDTATSQGTAISANNAWTEIIASTSQDYIGFSIVPSVATTTAANLNSVFEIGVGASGNEITFGAMPIAQKATEAMYLVSGTFFLFGREVPSGSRIAVRQSANTTAFDACVIAIPKS
jgi:hypothetical protein